MKRNDLSLRRTHLHAVEPDISKVSEMLVQFLKRDIPELWKHIKPKRLVAIDLTYLKYHEVFLRTVAPKSR